MVAGWDWRMVRTGPEGKEVPASLKNLIFNLMEIKRLSGNVPGHCKYDLKEIYLKLHNDAACYSCGGKL